MKKLAVLGASYLQLPLVEKAKELGVQVHCFAWDDGKAACKEVADFFYDISVLEKEAILIHCRRIGIDGILTIATDICVPTIAYIAEMLNLTGNSLECARLTTHKGLMRNCFYDNRIPSPEYILLKLAEDESLNKLKFPAIVKPADRSGSLGVVKVTNGTDLQEAVRQSLSVSFDKTCVVEQYIEGNEVSVETLSWKGKHQIITITDKVVTSEPYFVELAHHQPSQLPEDLQQKIKDISLQVLEATKVKNGASHIELKVNGDGDIYVIEIGSRMGGDFIGSHLVGLSTGFDYLGAVIDVALNQYDEQFEISDTHFSGVYFLSKNTERIMPHFQNEVSAGFKVIKKEIQDPELKLVQSSNDRSGYLIYQATKKIDIL